MKYIFYIILLSIITASCSQKNIVLSEDQLPEDVFYNDNDLKPFNGICTVFYTNSDNKKEELSFENGVLNGCHTSYYKNGNIRRQGYYKNGSLDGKWIMLNEKGIRIYEVEYKNDTLSGVYKTWYATGVPRAFGTYLQNKKSGQWVYYDEAGMITKKESL
jgi:antitoxin component YwqK of YwqJK toxin-antitoxin module